MNWRANTACPRTSIVKLASNENPRGPSPKVRAAIAAAAADITRYPDGNGFALKAALAARLRRCARTDRARQRLERRARAGGAGLPCVRATRRSIRAARLCRLSAGDAGARCDRHRGARARLRPRPRCHARRDHAAHAHRLRRQSEQPHRHVVVLRPRSRRFLPRCRARSGGARRGLRRVSRAGAALDERKLARRTPQPDRVAHLFEGLWAGGPAHRLRPDGRRGGRAAQSACASRSTSIRVAQAAALAALADVDYVAESAALNRAGLRELAAALDAMGVDYVPSHGNFLLIRVGDAAAVYVRLLRQGVIVRPVANYGLPEHLRVTVGLPDGKSALLKRAAIGAGPMNAESHRQTGRHRCRAHRRLVCPGAQALRCDGTGGRGRPQPENLDAAQRARHHRPCAHARRTVDATKLADADLVLLATPVGQMPSLFAAIAPRLGAHTVVTDAGSTKRDVIAAARADPGRSRCRALCRGIRSPVPNIPAPTAAFDGAVPRQAGGADAACRDRSRRARPGERVLDAMWRGWCATSTRCATTPSLPR